jgi:hypothetical protein
LIDQVKSEELIPSKRMGPLVCVSVIEGSSHAKARVMACKECSVCVEKIGLSGIGKKGVLVAAKSFSEEKFTENRNALLDLLELLLSRMNGDMQRFVRICGPSLSEKARNLIEERLKKSSSNDASSTTSNSTTGIPPPTAARISRIPKSPAASKIPAASRTRTTPIPQTSRNEVNGESPSGFRDELPSLDLRFGSHDSSIPKAPRSSAIGPISHSRSEASETGNTESDTGGSILSDAQGMISQSSSTSFVTLEEEALISLRDTMVGSTTSEQESLPTRFYHDAKGGSSPPSPTRSTNVADETTKPEESSSTENLGAAASLRARLMKIRDKNKIPTAETESTDKEDEEPMESTAMSPVSHTTRTVQPKTATISETTKAEPVPQKLQESAQAQANNGEEEDDVFKLVIGNIKRLVERITPLAEDDDDVIACTDSLKAIHAAVSNQPNLAGEMETKDVLKLRVSIAQHTNETISNLTR